MRCTLPMMLKSFDSLNYEFPSRHVQVGHGGYLGGLKMYSPTEGAGTSKILGPAYTVRIVPADDKSPP
ncbi:hypothetical protein OPT61_g8583 [Boeremia exigua]|uniref:Uncharacterized protein n=1 Tax=Boeremia exigua TaxID=749465 RepID=A0ACC2HY02_9PLEO|nr:hypothetical protein OPT61_g8583 [Boeremia exigua]